MSKYKFLYVDFVDGKIDYTNYAYQYVRLIGIIENIWEYDEVNILV